MTGINTVIFYSTTIFALAGVQNAFLGTVMVGVLNVVITTLSGYLVDKAGRKILLTLGTWIMFVSLLLLGGILLPEGVSPAAISIVAVGSMLLFVFGFAIGIGAVQWVVVGEVVPTKIRSKAYSIFVTSNWTANLVISLVTLSLIDALGRGVAPAGAPLEEQRQMGVAVLYLLFSGMCVLCLAFLYFRVPETKHAHDHDHHEEQVQEQAVAGMGMAEATVDEQVLATAAGAPPASTGVKKMLISPKNRTLMMGGAGRQQSGTETLLKDEEPSSIV